MKSETFKNYQQPTLAGLAPPAHPRPFLITTHISQAPTPTTAPSDNYYYPMRVSGVSLASTPQRRTTLGTSHHQFKLLSPPANTTEQSIIFSIS